MRSMVMLLGSIPTCVILVGLSMIVRATAHVSEGRVSDEGSLVVRRNKNFKSYLALSDEGRFQRLESLAQEGPHSHSALSNNALRDARRCYSPTSILGPGSPSQAEADANLLDLMPLKTFSGRKLLRSSGMTYKSVEDIHRTEAYKKFSHDARLFNNEGVFLGNLAFVTMMCVSIYCRLRVTDKAVSSTDPLNFNVRSFLILAGVFFTFGSFCVLLKAVVLSNASFIDQYNSYGITSRRLVYLIKAVGNSTMQFAALILVMISPEHFDLDFAFLIDYKYVFLLLMGYCARHAIVSVYMTIGHARLVFCRGFYADNVAFHLSSGLWWLSLCVGPGLAIWLCVQQAVHVLGWVRTERGTRLPLPPRFYPSSVLGLWWFFSVLFRNYDACFVILGSKPEHAYYKAIAGGVAFVPLAYSISRWLFSNFTDQEDVSSERTERFFRLIQGCVIATLVRETIRAYLDDKGSYLNLRHTFLTLYGLPLCCALVVAGSVVSFGRQQVFDCVSGWLENIFALCGRRKSTASEIARHTGSE